jgi:exonuclease SbcC
MPEMRPLRLDVEGFGTFRSPLTLDFSDADYFALVGPTGSGKTTVIDALCFALYGSAPRWPKRDQISLAMAKSVGHCRVTLVFDIAQRRFAATRALSRSARGLVMTKEARLVELPAERGVEGELAAFIGDELATLAATPGEMRAAVENLTGLSWDHFIQSVVLPQGDFARFLHSEPRDRQGLLVSLLGLDIYEQVMKRSNLVSKELQIRAATLREQLVHYAADTNDAVRAAEARAAELAEFPKLVAGDVAQLIAATADVEQAKLATEDAARQLAALAAIQPPKGLDELVGRRTRAVDAEWNAAEELRAASEDQDAADTEAKGTGDPRDWRRIVEQHDQLTELGTALVVASAAAEEADEALTQAKADLDAARAAVELAEAQLEATRAAHAADAVADTLIAGEACPVCLQIVSEVPDRPGHWSLEQAELARRASVAELSRAASVVRTAESAADRASASLAHLQRQVETIELELRGTPSRVASLAAMENAVAAHEALHAANLRLREAVRASQSAKLAVSAIDEEWSAANAAFQAVRDPFAGEGAPAASGDPAQDWAALVSWAASRRSALEEGSAERRQALEEAAARMNAARRAVTATFAEMSVPVPEVLKEVDIITAATRAADESANAAKRARERRETAAALEEQITTAETEEKLHRDLALFLDARHFERWIVAEALERLVAGASGILSDLSGGQFELSLGEDQSIEVVDHNDASSRRLVLTLSGGETFQASLAMALALSSQIASISAISSRQLDTILLDEGFGTLDSSTLDVVASSLEQLAVGGERTVGLVTHVAALAERVPVRFEVSRQGSTSSVVKEYA